MNIACFRNSKFRYCNSSKAITMVRLPRTHTVYGKEVCIPDGDEPVFRLRRAVFSVFREIGGVWLYYACFGFGISTPKVGCLVLLSHLKDLKRIFLRKEKMKIYKLSKKRPPCLPLKLETKRVLTSLRKRELIQMLDDEYFTFMCTATFRKKFSLQELEFLLSKARLTHRRLLERISGAMVGYEETRN